MKKDLQPKVIFFQRKPRPGFNFSIETVFENVRHVLKNKIQASVQFSSRFNDGYFTKLYNIAEAAFRQKKDSVSHITGETHFLNLFMRKKNVLLTIHDCRFMQRKQGFQKKLMQWLYLQAPVKKSSFIVAVSNATRKDIIKYTYCSAGKISVIPVPVNAVFKASPKKFNIAKPVILQIGTAENKNLFNLFQALKNIPCHLVIIGQLSSSQIKQLKELNIEFTSKQNLTEHQLFEEYIHCDMLTFISTFEGFGMPIVEAQFVERPVITSNISSMPEVAGEGACLINPYDVEDIRKGFLKMIHNDDYREYLIEKGRENRKRFNAQTIAMQYYDLYEKMYKNIIA